MTFNDQVAVVTGGGSGIGAACARLIVSRGGKVVVADRNMPAATAVADSLGACAVEVDVGDEAAVRSAEQWIRGNMGPITTLVNCAGVLQRAVPPDQLTMKEWDLVLSINLRGTYLCAAVFGKDMAERGRGSIVNIASVAGVASGPVHAYGPAKAGVIHLTKCLAAEWGPRGVRVNSVSPGFTNTPALMKGVLKQTVDIDLLAQASAMGRLVEADEIAAGACFLASDLASAITGVNLVIDAGYLVATPWMSYGGLRANAGEVQNRTKSARTDDQNRAAG